MSLIKKSDVKNHLSPRYRTKIHLCELGGPSGTTGSVVDQPEAIEARPSTFAKDFTADHSSSGIALVSTDPVTRSSGTLTVPASTHVQA